jgi:hypothetical protein
LEKVLLPQPKRFSGSDFLKNAHIWEKKSKQIEQKAFQNPRNSACGGLSSQLHFQTQFCYRIAWGEGRGPRKARKFLWGRKISGSSKSKK